MQLKSIQWRISLWAGGAILAVATILVLYALNSSQRTHELVKEQTQRLIMNSVEKEVSAQVEHGASILTNRIESALSNARGLVPVFASLKETQKNQKAGAIRLEMNDILKNTLKSNQDLLGIYTAWEPNSLDTFDYLYKNDKENGYDGTGRFIPYWSKDQSGNVNLEALADYENQQRTENGDRVGEYYLCPRDNKKECITNPYVYEVSGKEVLLTSLVTPIILNGEFVGVTGVDISLQFLNKLTDKISKSIYNGQNEVIIISNNGTVSAHNKNMNVGKHLKSLYPNEWKERLSMIQSGEMLFKAAPGDNNIHVIVPIYFGNTGTPWSMMVKLPKTIVMAGVNELDARISAEIESDRTWQIVIGAAVTILALCFIWLASAGIVKPIRNSVDILVRAAKGDLTPRIEVRTQDETGELSKACNTLLDRTQPVIADVIKSSQLISESAEQSAVIASQTSNGVNKQQQEVDLLTAAANEMAATAQSVADSASLAAKATNEAQSEANKSQSVINDTTDSINILADEVKKAAQVILQLETESKSIHSIIDVIRGIADQTNLLALNAAIEAARAGDQGRGFAVVADEVRTLAQRTQESTEEIQKMIENLQKGTTEAVQVMGQGQEKAENSVSKAVQAGQSLESIMQAVSTINDLNIQVASAAEQQNAVAEDISKNLSIIAKVAEETASGSQLSASSSDELTKLSDRLNKLVQQFTV